MKCNFSRLLETIVNIKISNYYFLFLLSTGATLNFATGVVKSTII